MEFRLAALGTSLARRRRCRAAAWLGTLLLMACAAAGCGPGRPSRWNLAPDVQRPEPGVVIFLVDGLPPRFVEQGCAEGWLPHIQQRFRGGGAVVRRASTVVPSITYAAIASLLTGVGPDRHQILGNRWFDPDAALFRSYVEIAHYRDVNGDLAVPTLYELIQPAPSASIQSAFVGGATLDIANWAPSGIMWFFGDFTAVDKLTASSLWQVTAWANSTRRWPTVLTCYFPGLDTIGHRNGIGSPRFRWAAAHIDYQIDRLCAWFERQGLLDTTYLILVSDHGMSDGHRHGQVDLLHLVRDRWGRTATNEMRQDGPESLRRAFYERFDTVVNDQDGRRASLHLRSPEGWGVVPSPAWVESVLTAVPEDEQLWNVDGVDVAAYLVADDVAVIRSAAGRARIEVRRGADGPEYAYIPEPNDVLEYTAGRALRAFVAEGYHSSRAWLHATAGAVYPDVVPHLISLLHVRRAGQVVVFARPGYSFVAENGGHGGIRTDDMLMTFLLAGPGIAPGTAVAAARAVDLTPTVLDLLGITPDENLCLEGQSLRQAGLLSAAGGGGRP